MSEPSKFIQSSDYLSIGADSWPTITLTIPNSIVIASGATWTMEATTTVPDSFTGKAIRPNVSFSKNGNYYYGVTVFLLEAGTSPPGANYYVTVRIYRKSASVVAMEASIGNTLFPATSLTTSATGGTLTAEVRTLVIS